MGGKQKTVNKSSKAEEIIRKHKAEILDKCKSYLNERLLFFELSKLHEEA